MAYRLKCDILKGGESYATIELVTIVLICNASIPILAEDLTAFYMYLKNHGLCILGIHMSSRVN